MSSDNASITGFIVAILAILVGMAAWFTHVVNCIKDEQWFLLVIGLLAAPIGWVHGLGIWFGWFS